MTGWDAVLEGATSFGSLDSNGSSRRPRSADRSVLIMLHRAKFIDRHDYGEEHVATSQCWPAHGGKQRVASELALSW